MRHTVLLSGPRDFRTVKQAKKIWSIRRGLILKRARKRLRAWRLSGTAVESVLISAKNLTVTICRKQQSRLLSKVLRLEMLPIRKVPFLPFRQRILMHPQSKVSSRLWISIRNWLTSDSENGNG